jgi:3-methylfumaryl-CoA hydratase
VALTVFLPLHRQSEIGPDGHARRGGFPPPVPLPRRMWAGGRFEFRRSMRIGDAIRRTWARRLASPPIA